VVFWNQVSFSVGNEFVEKPKVARTLVSFVLKGLFSFEKFGEWRENAEVVHGDECVFKLTHVLNVSETYAAFAWGGLVA